MSFNDSFQYALLKVCIVFLLLHMLILFYYKFCICSRVGVHHFDKRFLRQIASFFTAAWFRNLDMIMHQLRERV